MDHQIDEVEKRIDDTAAKFSPSDVVKSVPPAVEANGNIEEKKDLITVENVTPAPIEVIVTESTKVIEQEVNVSSDSAIIKPSHVEDVQVQPDPHMLIDLKQVDVPEQKPAEENQELFSLNESMENKVFAPPSTVSDISVEDIKKIEDDKTEKTAEFLKQEIANEIEKKEKFEENYEQGNAKIGSEITETIHEDDTFLETDQLSEDQVQSGEFSKEKLNGIQDAEKTDEHVMAFITEKKQQLEKLVEKATEPEEKLGEKLEKKIIEKFVEKPAEPLAEKLTERLVEKIAVKPAEKLAEKPEENPVKKLAENPVEKNSGEKPAENPMEKPAERPAEKPVKKPVDIGPNEFFSKYGLVEAFIYWRDPKLSGIVFGSGLVLLLSLAYFSFISVVANAGLVLLSGAIVFRIYKDVMQTIQKTSQPHPFSAYLEKDLKLPTLKIHELVDVVVAHLDACLNELRRLFLVVDFVETLKFGLGLWVLTYIGSWFNGLTLVTIGYIALFTLPKVYENNKVQIDENIGVVRAKLKEVSDKIGDALPAPLRRKPVEKKE